MKISGFTMVKNVSKLYYPIKASISSLLPLVDEFVVALGQGDEDDNTRDIILSINNPKIKIIDTIWDTETFPNGMENAHQTDIAKSHCNGDWLFYLQADEVIHEKYLDAVESKCKEVLNNRQVDGLLFNYRHFFGDYNHYVDSHGWYAKEIRVVRNDPEIHSFASAQSFRKIPGFDGLGYRNKKGTSKLKVVECGAYIFHYGWVRPPEYMTRKSVALSTIHKGAEKAREIYKKELSGFDYGPLGRLPEFKGTHPRVMEEWIKDFSWQHKLCFEKTLKVKRKLMKHERFKYRLISFLEKWLFAGKRLFDYSNWQIIKG